MWVRQGVFTSLIETLGVKNVQFEELVSLDPETIRSLRFVPSISIYQPASQKKRTKQHMSQLLTDFTCSPVYGVIFLFKYASPTGGNGSQDPTSPPPTSSPTLQDGTYDRSTATDDGGLFFAAQTIQNACGTQAVLSVILNQDTPSTESQSQTQTQTQSQTRTTDSNSNSNNVDIGSSLRSFKDFTSSFPPDLRGEALSNSALIRGAHNAFARASPFVDESARPASDAEDADLYHFVAYVPFRGTLYELDGLQPHPISHGPCRTDVGDTDTGAAAESKPESDDFADKIINVLRRRIARYPTGEIRFNLMAAVRDPRAAAAAIGDTETLERETRKRRAWAWENALRRCNFVGFIGEVAKGVVEGKVRERGGYEAWVEASRDDAARRSGERVKRKREEDR